ncbi:DUF2621 domain-containing protein [Paenibacillus sp. HB172176]|uniref:DUF2621 domain-containing protein n=1 Tax=Paenibacillus sp. HB172176 TaxID=2493690 RepID=UPI0014394D48|nr:DUF2621 domain-containing protein [Paenibacillus sp. HB172176]
MGNAPNWFMYFIVFWAVVMVIAMAIGGFFMFRKFLKVLPMRDGKSKLDWQNYWVERSRSMWTEESKQFLEELVSPVPTAFRDIAKHSIAAKIGQVAIERHADTVTREHCIEGYIKATPKRDYRSLVSFLERKGIDYSNYQNMLNK